MDNLSLGVHPCSTYLTVLCAATAYEIKFNETYWVPFIEVEVTGIRKVFQYANVLPPPSAST